MNTALPSKERSRARKAKAPVQLGLFEPPRMPTLPVTPSPAALAIATDVDMRNQAVRVLSEKSGKPVAKQTKPRPKVLTS